MTTTTTNPFATLDNAQASMDNYMRCLMNARRRNAERRTERTAQRVERAERDMDRAMDRYWAACEGIHEMDLYSQGWIEGNFGREFGVDRARQVFKA